MERPILEMSREVIQMMTKKMRIKKKSQMKNIRVQMFLVLTEDPVIHRR